MRIKIIAPIIKHAGEQELKTRATKKNNLIINNYNNLDHSCQDRSRSKTRRHSALNQTHKVIFEEKFSRRFVGNLENIEKLYGEPTWPRQYFHDLMEDTGVEPDTDPLVLFIDNPHGVMNYLDNSIGAIDKIFNDLPGHIDNQEKNSTAELQRIRTLAAEYLANLENLAYSVVCSLELKFVCQLYDFLMSCSYVIPCLHGQMITHHLHRGSEI